MPKPSVTHLLKEIKSEEIETVYIHVTHKAEEWAVAGFIEEANQLLEKLWSYGTQHSGHLWIPDQGFMVMWQLSGKSPQHKPFAKQDVAEIDRLNYNNLFLVGELQSSVQEIPNYSIESIGEYLLLAQKSLDVQKNAASAQIEIDGYEKQLAANIGGYGYFQPATCGAILAARFGDTKKAEHFIKLWGEGYFANWANYSLSYLMRDIAVAKILLTGILAPMLKLTKETIQQDFEQIAAALNDRYSVGRGLVYGWMGWKQLLQKISVLAIGQQSNDFTEQAVAQQWLGTKPALKQHIDAAEAKLGIVLPEDYKEFLLASDGFSAISPYTDVTLAPVKDIQRYNDYAPDSVEIWSEGRIDDPVWAGPFKNSIIIGGFIDEQELLLLPFEDGHWECWFFANWVPGERVYPSFRYYMEELLQKLEDKFYE